MGSNTQRDILEGRISAPSEGIKNTIKKTVRAEQVKTPLPAGYEERLKPKSYVEMYAALHPTKTQEEIEREERREKRDENFAAVGDTISAISNLIATANYAPNAYNHNQSMTTQTRNRFERIKAARDANANAWRDGMYRAWAMDEEKKDNERAWKRLLKQDEEARQAREDARRGAAEAIARQERWREEDKEDKKAASAEQKRQFDEEIKARKKIAYSNRSTGSSRKPDYQQFVIGDGKGLMTIPETALNDNNAAYVFGLLPQEVRDKAFRENGKKPLDANEMWRVIGQNSTADGIEDAIRLLGGEIKKSKKKEKIFED